MTDLKFDEDATKKIAVFPNQLATLNAYDAAIEYKEAHAPYVVFSMTNVNAVPTRRANEC